MTGNVVAPWMLFAAQVPKAGCRPPGVLSGLARTSLPKAYQGAKWVDVAAITNAAFALATNHWRKREKQPAG